MRRERSLEGGATASTGLLSRTVATVTTAIARAQAHARENCRAQWELSRQSAAVASVQWFLPGRKSQETPAGTVAITDRVCFACPNNSRAMPGGNG